MAKSAVISFRAEIHEHLKIQQICSQKGLSVTQVLNMMVKSFAYEPPTDHIVATNGNAAELNIRTTERDITVKNKTPASLVVLSERTKSFIRSLG